jgi:sarcosine oxidase subunit gamma
VTATDPLAAHADRLRAASGEGVRLRGLSLPAQIGLRVAPGSEAAAAVAGVLGTDLPGPTAVAAAGERSVLWLGPDEWLVVGPPGTAAEVAGQLAAAVGDEGAVVDLSANRVVLELAGPDSREVLATCCPLDLHPRVFGPGRCAGTLLAGAQVILEQTAEEPAFRLYVRPSFVAYAVDWLTAGADGIRAARALRS